MKTQQRIDSAKALFIKLGENGEWERECINSGTLRLGYNNVPHEHCLSADWKKARRSFLPSADPGSVTRHLNQVQQFYEESAETLWITFFRTAYGGAFQHPTSFC